MGTHGTRRVSAPFIPQTYVAWRRCIEVDCGIPLTPAFIAARLHVWRNPAHEETLNFVRLYGPAHLKRVVSWFDLAAH